LSLPVTWLPKEDIAVYRRSRQVRKRNLFLLAGLLLLIVAVSKKPTLLLFLLTTKGRAHIFLMGFAALLCAFGFRRFGDMFLRRKSVPWYARRGSLLLLAIMASLYCLIAGFIDSGIFAAIRLGPVFAEKAYLYEFFGFVLIWTVLLEWVSYR
jgi:hypothetical protein